MYLGTSTGNLHIYALAKSNGGTVKDPRTVISVIDPILVSDGQLEAAFEDCKKGLGRRAIEQLGYIKDVNSLVVLVGEYLALPWTNAISNALRSFTIYH